MVNKHMKKNVHILESETDLCELEVYLVYTESLKTVKAT